MTSKIYIHVKDVELKSWKDIERHYLPSECPMDWQNGIPLRHWRKGYSAYELAHSWEAANPNLPWEIQTLFGDSAELLVATPEHETPLPGGPTGSHSDVLAFIRTKGGVCAVAVEGKKEEPFDRPVHEWLEDASDGKIERLQFLFKKLGLPYMPDSEIRYQLLHRTAAALIEAKCLKANCAAMIVHSFSKEHTWFGDFENFLDLLGINKVKPDVLYKHEELGIPLYLGWATGKKVTQ